MPFVSILRYFGRVPVVYALHASLEVPEHVVDAIRGASKEAEVGEAAIITQVLQDFANRRLASRSSVSRPAAPVPAAVASAPITGLGESSPPGGRGTEDIFTDDQEDNK